MAKIINMVVSECQPEVEEEFNKWYDEIHIPMLFKYKGMTKVTRYKVLDQSGEHPSYLAVYEFEDRPTYQAYENSPEIVEARAEMKETWKEGGWEIKQRVQYEELKTWEK
jgi:antibiotic biosynthesis monooxygenase (ABM) superfamily enzyme